MSGTAAETGPRLADGTPYFGRRGEMAYDPVADRVQCHLCGQWLRWVGGQHLACRHGWTIAEYRATFGLAASISTMAAGSRARLRAHAVDRVQDGRLATPLAGGSRPARSWRPLADTHPQLAGELHPTRNPQLEVALLGPWSSEPVWWRCGRCGHDWQARVLTRTSAGSSCPACGARATAARGPGATAPRTLPPDVLAQWHPDRNGDLDVSRVGEVWGRAVWWRCQACGHEWRATPRARAWRASERCPRCAPGSAWVPKHGVVPAERSLAARHPDLAAEFHRDRNPDLDPGRLGVWSKRLVWWRCGQCGQEWQARVSNRAQGTGCPRCAAAQRLATYHAHLPPRAPA